MPTFNQSISGGRYPESLEWRSFTQLNEAESLAVLDWRNHDAVRCWMRNSREISLEEHQQFLESLSVTKDKYYFLLSYAGRHIAVADFYRISNDDHSCYYGYYLNPDFMGASYGLLLEYWVAEFAFSDLKMLRLHAETKPDNKSAVELHAFCGFSTQQGLNADGLQEAVLNKTTWREKRAGIESLLSRHF